MMDGMDDGMDDVLGGDSKINGDADKDRANSHVDLESDNSLVIDISDALSEKDKVKFTVHTKTTLSNFKQSEMSVVRLHEEFTWLHDRFVEEEKYAGLIIPPPPPRPDFDASREKLQRLSEAESSLTKEEFTKMKSELEAEYLATFKKTVAMHEVFLQRVAEHDQLRHNENFIVFLEFTEDLCARSKNKKEKLGGFLSALTRKADETIILSGQKEPDEFFEQQRTFLQEYNQKLNLAVTKADSMTRKHKDVADTYIKLSTGLNVYSNLEDTELDRYLSKVSECFEKSRKLEGRQASDFDLKMSDTLRYYANDTRAALDLLYRRSRALANFENANKMLDKARSKNKGVAEAEESRQKLADKFDHISEVAKAELERFKKRRVQHTRKNLIDLSELQLKHSKAKTQLLKSCLTALKED